MGIVLHRMVGQSFCAGDIKGEKKAFNDLGKAKIMRKGGAWSF